MMWRQRRAARAEARLQREIHEDARRRMPWLQMAASMHHAQHPGEYRDDCGRCNPDVLVRLLVEFELSIRDLHHRDGTTRAGRARTRENEASTRRE